MGPPPTQSIPRSPRPGAPYTYITTEEFPSHFGLGTLCDLPVSSRRTSPGRLCCVISSKPRCGEPLDTGEEPIDKNGEYSHDEPALEQKGQVVRQQTGDDHLAEPLRGQNKKIIPNRVLAVRPPNSGRMSYSSLNSQEEAGIPPSTPESMKLGIAICLWDFLISEVQREAVSPASR